MTVYDAIEIRKYEYRKAGQKPYMRNRMLGWVYVLEDQIYVEMRRRIRAIQ